MAGRSAVRLRWEKDAMSDGIVRAINQTRGTTLCEFIENAGGLAGQSRGLLGR
jgi:hypothetical protein